MQACCTFGLVLRLPYVCFCVRSRGGIADCRSAAVAPRRLAELLADYVGSALLRGARGTYRRRLGALGAPRAISVTLKYE